MLRASEKRCHKNESIRRKPDAFCSLQIVDGILKILVEPPDVQPVDGFVVDLETDWEYEPAVLHLIIAPAYAGDAVIGVYMPLVGQRQHRQPRQARKIDQIVAPLGFFDIQRRLRLRKRSGAAASGRRS